VPRRAVHEGAEDRGTNGLRRGEVRERGRGAARKGTRLRVLGQELVSKWVGTRVLASNAGCMTSSRAGSGRRRVGRVKPLKWRVSDELWEQLAPLLLDPPRRFRSPGRLRYPARACLEGILYVLYTDTPWVEVPYRALGLPSGEDSRRR